MLISWSLCDAYFLQAQMYFVAETFTQLHLLGLREFKRWAQLLSFSIAIGLSYEN